MDTGSESFRSQDTPNSIRSSDFEDNPEQNVLRLQNPEDTGDLLTTPDVFKNFHSQEVEHNETSIIEDLNALEPPKNSILQLSKPESENEIKNKMSSLRIDSARDVRPNHLGISPPKFCSTLTLTTDHPLMGLGSPDDFPDLIPKNHKEDDKDLSLSSIEDERVNDTNGLYSPQRNTSKNNLYFTENFGTVESHFVSDSLGLPPDVTNRVERRRKIIPKFELTPQRVLDRNVDVNKDEFSEKITSTPKYTQPVDIASEEFHSVSPKTHFYSLFLFSGLL